ncbi:MAG: histidine triad nucleotide-binding protein [Deltaproteobacteria bacterium]|nr:MAG: histidine triad nucleotide-binding protein [Deltaproteobacteria bacterium]
MDNCLFCKIIAGEIPAEKLYEDDEMLAFKDIAPQAPTHFLVIPKKHISGLNKLEEQDEMLMGKLVRTAAKLAGEQGVGDDFRTVVNTGSGAGQTVFHIHVHILGGRNMLWPPG